MRIARIYSDRIEVERDGEIILRFIYDGDPVAFCEQLIPHADEIIDMRREQLIAEINRQRDEALAAGFTYNGALYHCDETFQSQVQGFIIAWQTGVLPADATVAIRRKDNVIVQMGYEDVLALGAALLQHVQGIYAASWAAKDALG